MAQRKYVGVRVSYVNNDFKLMTHFLGIKWYCPSSKLRENTRGQLSQHLTVWVRHVLQSFGIEEKHILVMVSDKGSDVTFVQRKLNVDWEWCTNHQLHVAMREGFGDVKPRRCKNPECRQIVTILRTVSRLFRSGNLHRP